MTLPSDPYNFTNGNTADAEQVDARFAALYAALAAGGLDAEALASQAWTAYTPTYANVTLGTSPTNTARYVKLGRTVHVQGALTLGSSTGDVTGAVTATLPPHAAATSLNQTGVCRAFDTSGSVLLQGYAVIDTGTPTLVDFYLPGTQVITDATPDPVTALTPPAHVTTAVPFDWAPGDFLRWAITYEAAA